MLLDQVSVVVMRMGQQKSHETLDGEAFAKNTELRTGN